MAYRRILVYVNLQGKWTAAETTSIRTTKNSRKVLREYKKAHTLHIFRVEDFERVLRFGIKKGLCKH